MQAGFGLLMVRILTCPACFLGNMEKEPFNIIFIQSQLRDRKQSFFSTG